MHLECWHARSRCLHWHFMVPMHHTMKGCLTHFGCQACIAYHATTFVSQTMHTWRAAMWYHMSLFFDDLELTLGYSIVASAGSINGVIGSALAAGLLSMNGILGLRGWQWLFLLEGIPTVILGIVLWCCLARSPSSAGFLEPNERAWLEDRSGNCCLDAGAYWSESSLA